MGKYKDKKRRKKIKEHLVFNKKMFLAPESETSMSAIHAKIRKDGTAELRLSDCNGTIRWLNDLNDLDQVREMLTKIDSATSMLLAFRDQVKIKLP